VRGPISIDIPPDARSAYEALARMAGLNIVFDAGFRSVPVTPFRRVDIDILDAFDRLSAQTGTFVEILDNKTILVSPDNPINHRDYDTQVLKTFYFDNARTQQPIAGIITELRNR